MHIYTVYNLHCCVLKRMPCECMFPKQMKRAKANQKHVISWMLWRHNGFSVLSQSSCSPCLQGFFFSCLFIIHAATAGDRESRRFNRDGGTSRKPIIHGIWSLHFCAEALNGFDIPWWITTTKWEGERRGGSKKARDWKRKSRRNSLPSLPRGVQCVGGVLYVSLASVSPLSHPRKSLKPNEVPAEEFLHPVGACVLLCLHTSS